MPETSDTGAKRYEFKAEVKQLLDILVHSVYTSKDIFVRELVSNAADALEKVRFAKVRGDAVVDADTTEEIRIETRKDDNILVIRDTGIGMTGDELRTNLGTIAHSGATAFLEQLQKQKEDADVNLIGRFGIGFYSVFMAADKVVITTRSADEGAVPVVWVSDGLGSYTLEEAEGEVPRGTQIEIHLKKDEDRFAEKLTVENTIRKYSNFIPFPIFVDDEQVNTTTALWREPSHQVSADQYNEFFKFLSFDSQEPLARLHLSVDVPIQFSALLFVPRTNTEAMGFGEGNVSLQLYVKRVLIDGANEDLLPKYLRFATGVVESEDLPLSISRETLQENRVMVKIRENLTRQVLDELAKLAEKQPEDYTHFWRTFGRILKEGYADFSNAEKIRELLRFNSSVHDDAESLCGLREYVDRCPEAQDSIYYLTGATREALQRDPRLELFRKKNIEVLYLYDAADEFVLGAIGTYQEKNLVSADQAKPEDLKALGDPTPESEDKDDDAPQAAELQPLVDRFQEILGDRVSGVSISERLVDSPACLVSPDGMSTHMDKMMRYMNQSQEAPKRALEINADHALIRGLAKMVEQLASDPFVTRACEQIFEGALLADGYLSDPHQLVERMNDILTEAAELRLQK